MAMNTSVLLSNGKRMPLLGLGTWQGEEEEAEAAVETAISAGYRHIDTAFAYHNEKVIGNALKKAFESNKVRREDMFIVTKLPMNGNRKENVRHFFTKSLKSLQLEYIDLYLIHVPISTLKQENDEDCIPKKEEEVLVEIDVDLVQTWKEMEKFVDEGLARAIGLSNFNSEQIKRIYENARIKPANLQVECHAYHSQTQLFEFCKKLNISLTAYAPLGSPGLLEYAKKRFGAKTPENKLPSLLGDPEVAILAEKYKKTPAQILLRYLIQRGIIVIPKSVNPKRIVENSQVFDFKLTQEDMETLLGLSRNFRYFTFDFLPGMQKHPEYPFNIPF